MQVFILFLFYPNNHYLLTHSVVQSPSWEANWFAASQEILRISPNPKVHYRTNKRPPPVSILGQLSLVHITTSHLLENRPNIIHPSTPRSSQWSLSIRFPHQYPITPSPQPYASHTQPIPNNHYRNISNIISVPLEQTAFVVQWSEFLATDTEVPGSIPGATSFSEQQWVWNGVHSAS